MMEIQLSQRGAANRVNRRLRKSPVYNKTNETVEFIQVLKKSVDFPFLDAVNVNRKDIKGRLRMNILNPATDVNLISRLQPWLTEDQMSRFGDI
jgi:hypothetical protein